MNTLLPKSPSHPHEKGSSLFIILIAVALFAALSYAISQQGGSGNALSQERTRLLASDVIDMGNKLSDTTARLRLKKISNTLLSFENGIVAGYTNPACTLDNCKIFAFDGGGMDWETPTNDVNGAKDWGFTGNIAIQDIGTTNADLVAFLPNLSLALCNRINILIGIYGTGGTPSVLAVASGNKFIGTFTAVPITLSSAPINGQSSACIQVSTATGTAFTGAPLTNNYIYYQVLESR